MGVINRPKLAIVIFPASVSEQLTRDLLFVAGGIHCYWKARGPGKSIGRKSHLSMPGLLWTSVTGARSTVLPRSSTPLEHDRMRAPDFHLRHHFTERVSVFQKLWMHDDTGGRFEERVVECFSEVLVWCGGFMWLWDFRNWLSDSGIFVGILFVWGKVYSIMDFFSEYVFVMDDH